MNKKIMAMAIIGAVCAAGAYAATITVSTKSTGDQLTAAEFNQLLDANRYGTRDVTHSNETVLGTLHLTGIPTATNGLSDGAVWSDSGTLKVFSVP